MDIRGIFHGLGGVLIAASTIGCAGAVASDEDSADAVEGTVTAACTGFKVARSLPAPPRLRDVTGPQASAVTRALSSLLAGRGSPVDTAGRGYRLTRLLCSNVWAPVGGIATGFGCTLRYQIGGGPFFDIDEPRPSRRARALFTALDAAGVTPLDDPAHGAFVSLVEVVAKGSHLTFRDVSRYVDPDQNLAVEGGVALEVLRALAAAKIDDTSGKGSLVCERLSGPTECAFSPTPLDAGIALGRSASLRLWNALIAAARAGHLEPLDGTFAEAMAVNVRWLTYDGSTLEAHVTVSAVHAPPPP